MTWVATDKVQNEVQDFKGKVKEAPGRATDDRSLENKGKMDQAKGSTAHDLVWFHGALCP